MGLSILGEQMAKCADVIERQEFEKRKKKEKCTSKQIKMVSVSVGTLCWNRGA